MFFMDDKIEYTTQDKENLRAEVAMRMLPVLYEHIKKESVLTDSKLMSVVCEESIKYADEMLCQLGINT